MIRHFFKLAWRRKGGNALLILEILASFLVVFAVATAAIQLGGWYRMPLGYDYHDVWEVSIDRQRSNDDAWSPEETAGAERLLREGARIEGVVAIAGAMNTPYDFSTMISGYNFDGRHVEAELTEVTDAFRDVMKLDVVKGRWFEPTDSALAYKPVVVNERFAREMYPGEDPVGKSLPRDESEPETRIIGVVSDYRKGGEISIPGPFVMRRTAVGDASTHPPQKLVVRAQPGVGVEFEERLARDLQAVVPEWSLEARTLEANRTVSFRTRLTPLLVAGLVAGFLLTMVALGLIGVLWQNVTRRAREFGLRRAAGASKRDIQFQVLMEITLTALLGIAVGLVLVAQIPLIAFASFLSVAVIVAGAVSAIVLVIGLALAAAAYPSWLATRTHPADALRDE